MTRWVMSINWDRTQCLVSRKGEVPQGLFARLARSTEGWRVVAEFESGGDVLVGGDLQPPILPGRQQLDDADVLLVARIVGCGILERHNVWLPSEFTA